MRFVNPINSGIRNDPGGSGYHGAPRGTRRHNGVDFACNRGENVLMPVSGTIVRESLPYKDDLKWRGVHIVNDRIEIKVWYLEPRVGIIGNTYEAGKVIGVAQDIGEKKGYDNVTPHIHLRIVRIDPLLLFTMSEDLLLNVDEDYDIDAV